MKAFSRDDILKCIPVIWFELNKIKSRVEDVTRSLDNKTVKNEKLNEFKKQLLTNKRLKEYFNRNPQEKEILLNEIQRNQQKDNILFKHLDHLPFYVIPKQIMAITEEEISTCTVGLNIGIFGNAQGRISKEKQLEGAIGGSVKVTYAE